MPSPTPIGLGGIGLYNWIPLLRSE